MKIIKQGLVALSLIVSTALVPTWAQSQAEFDKYVAGLKSQALAKGYEQGIVEQAFSNVVFKKKVVKADRNQPEFVETLETYLPKRVPEWKVKKARDLYKKHQVMLEKIGQQYGVQPRFIVALWGLESAFGKYQGKYPLISSLVTLCFDGRREAFFKKELWNALDILQYEKVPYEKLKGSWAGAMGQVQFMPSSFKAYAVDYDGDGIKDVWGNMGDVFASAANYLANEGWNDDLTWGRQVKVPSGFDFEHAVPQKTRGRSHWLEQWNKTEKTLAQWQALGVRRADGSDLPKVDIKAAMMIPDGEKGRIYLAYDNYKVLMHWNRSYYFVTTVGYLSDRIAYPKVN
ncbi:lytic murein transglycosylase [Saccharobesus litoralis]|uniref:Lytic murein transglycosylase n=1 Tax=Saccharobesus litoralis TaxID=2172099 RepID=A0A2S0VUP6_9ALTE|nr:lytic murein transglycosylase [Saccharobesus litoralis]AWB67929.1 lytic murein transglycosylase [Saccharobesus litoralis]